MGSSLVITLLSIFIALYFTLTNSRDAMAAKIQSVAYVLADSVKQALIEHDNSVQQRVDTVATLVQADQITLFDEQGNIFSSYNPKKLPAPQAIKKEHFIMDNDRVKFFLPVTADQKMIGSLYIQADLLDYKKDLLMRSLYLLLLFMALLLVAYIFSKKMQKLLSEPILSLAKTAAFIRDEQNFGIRVSTSQLSEEIVVLYETFNEMLSKMEQRELQREVAEEEARKYQTHLEVLAEDLEERVSKRTQDLQESMKTLQEAQIQLVESEKMAALGNLVGGVAHEVNTPLGNAITSLSILTDTAKRLQEQLEEDRLKRSDLEKSLKLLSDTSIMIYSNVHRAADLIRSFKKISIDQISEERRIFKLKRYSYEIFTTFKAALKRSNVVWEIEMEHEASIYGYPGIYGQILANLIQNSLVHAFEGVDEKKIILKIEVVDDIVSLSFKDNGVGIAPEIIDMVFEPFVTTKRNQGGSGLGLNIVYNLVTQKLHGTLKVISKPDEGSEFLIRFNTKDEI